MKLSDRVVSEVLEDTSMNGAKFAALDGLRGIAVLTVFLSHSSGFRQRITPWTSFHGTGHIGVYLFFVLSGFLLCVSLLGSKTWTIPGYVILHFATVLPCHLGGKTDLMLCAVATVAYLLVEKPFIMLSRTLVRRRPNPA